MSKDFVLYPDELITKINKTLITKLPKSKKQKQQKQQKVTMQHIIESWPINNLKSLINIKSTKEVNVYLNPQKSGIRNYEADKRDRILHYKEQMTTFLASFVEGFNRLDPLERQVIYYYYFEELSEVKVANLMNLSRSGVQRLKKKAVIILIQNLEIASFLKGCFLLGKD